MKIPTEQFRISLRGKFKAQAIQMIQDAGFTYRITQVDGENFMGTTDFKLNRINLRLAKGKVIYS